MHPFSPGICLVTCREEGTVFTSRTSRTGSGSGSPPRSTSFLEHVVLEATAWIWDIVDKLGPPSWQQEGDEGVAVAGQIPKAGPTAASALLETFGASQ